MILNNKEITIERYTKTNGKTTYTDIVWNTVWAYIQPLSDDIIVWDDWMSSYEWFLLMSSFTDIKVWDKITDNNSVEYKVKWIKIFDTIIDKHIEAVIQTKYDN